MKIIIQIKLLILLIIVAGCGTVTPVLHEGNNSENYKKIFEESMPSNVQVVNSIYVTYSGFNIGVVTTPDWEIELIVNKKWIEDKVEELNLRKVESPKNRRLRFIKNRLKRTKDWYAPKPIQTMTAITSTQPASLIFICLLIKLL